MKLWVDDIRNAPDESWTVARTVTSAINCIAMFGEDITEISLDHDISHQVIVGALGRPYPCEETFTPVAQYICATYNEFPKITIHSSNTIGADKIKQILEDAGCKPTVAPMGMANRLEMEV